jgi:predicted hotdog family 3-hydroxylacyl-ACP dehydratase
MTSGALFEGEGIHLLIPQRAPMVMLDAFIEGNDTEAVTGLTVRRGNLFCTAGGRLAEAGLIEHVAQSASALAGYKSYRNDPQQPAPVGYIGEVKKFRIFRLPEVGESLRTSIRILSEVENISLLSAETKAGDEIIAAGQMKIFIRK